LLLDRGALEQAQTIAQKTSSAEPKNARAHAILAEIQTIRGDFTGAIQEFQEVVEIDPQRIENYGALGAAYRAANQLGEAEAAYRKAVEVNPKSSAAHIALSQFLFSAGKLEAAEVEMKSACDHDPQAIPPRILLARIYLATGRNSEAEQLYASLKIL